MLASGEQVQVGQQLRRILVALGGILGQHFFEHVAEVQGDVAVNVVRAQLEAIRDGKVEQAYALFSSEYRAGMTLPMFRRWLRREGRLAKVQNLEFWGRSVWGTTAVLRGSFRDDLGHRYPVRYLLVRENGAWRIENFHLSAEAPESGREEQRLLHI